MRLRLAHTAYPTLTRACGESDSDSKWRGAGVASRAMGRIPAGMWAVLAAAAVGTSLLLMPGAARPDREAPIDGFAPASLAAERDVERRIARFPSTRRIEADHRFLTAEPHVAGSPRDRLLAEWTRDQWIAAGLHSAEIVEHDLLLPHSPSASGEMISPPPRRPTPPPRP